MLFFKSEQAAGITLASIELVHMMRKQQGIFTSTAPLSLKTTIHSARSIIAPAHKTRYVPNEFLQRNPNWGIDWHE
ncbi:hypothetical protein FHW03_004749 [Ochrobactrum sp. RH2CCR150]|nr:hypothetical protein [Ochrobactrum sp. RH2CCR150]